jgi:hypothetical protein
MTASTFTIPGDPRDADAMLGELGELATATEWQRAAITYARVRVQEGQGRPTAEKATSDLLTPAQYAELGIHGLRSKTTIRAYWRAWDNAVADGLAVPVSLGDEVELPDAEWGDYYSLQSHSTPTYYRPSGVESVQDLDDTGGAGELGECPPMASNLEEPELSAEREQLDDATDDEGEDDDWLAKLRGKMITTRLRSTKTNAECALEYIRGTTEYDPKVVLEYVNTIRAILDDIVGVADGESLDDKVSRILDEGSDET